MPASIPIGMFVLGGVLLLIALLGGEFGIFGAHVQGRAGCSARVVAAAGAITLFAALVLAFLIDRSIPLISAVNSGYPPSDNQINTDPVNAVTIVDASPIPTRRVAQSTPITSSAISVRGTWYGTFVTEGGETYEYKVSFTQIGSRLAGTTRTSKQSDPQLSTTIKIKGSIRSDSVKFEEYELIDDTTGVSCFISASLTYAEDYQGKALIGTWSGTSGSGGCPGSGELELRKD